MDLSRLEWRKSSRSQLTGCVEVAFGDGQVVVRDSKDRQGPVLVFSPSEWRAFTTSVRNQPDEAADHV